ncbi:hypothetical protein FO519_010086, partial [Halicephalobus sp. NKZ332]
YGKQAGIDSSVLITVCTAGMATGPYAFVLSTIYSGVFLAVLYSVYLLSLLFLAKLRSSNSFMTTNNNQFRNQNRMFLQFFLVMLNYTIFYGIPFALSLLTVIFTLSSSVKSAITLFAGLSAGLNSSLDFLIYVFKHEEIKRSALKTLLDLCPSVKTAATITVTATGVNPQSKI